MAVGMHALKFPNGNIRLVGFEGNTIGRLWVAFQDTFGKPTVTGYYDEVPRALYNDLAWSHAPGKVLAKDIKPYFKWIIPEPGSERAIIGPELPTAAYEAKEKAALDPRAALIERSKGFKIPPVSETSIVIPKDVENTKEALDKCLRPQRRRLGIID